MKRGLFQKSHSHKLAYHVDFIRFLFKVDIVEVPLALFAPGLRKKIASFAGGKPKLVVDLLSGIGSAAIEFARRCPSARVIAVDLDPGVLDFVRMRARRAGVSNIEMVVADARELPFQADFADVVNISFGLHENKSHDRRMIIGESMRILKSGGVLLVADYGEGKTPAQKAAARFFLKFFEPSHAREVLTGQVEREIEDAGFIIEGLYGDLPLCRLVRAVKPHFHTVDRENRRG